MPLLTSPPPTFIPPSLSRLSRPSTLSTRLPSPLRPPRCTRPHVRRTPLQMCAPSPAPLKLLYDGACPLCVREVNFLRSRSTSKTLSLIDISEASYTSSQTGITYEKAMSTIHAITPSGEVLTGIPAFRATYEAIGLGWIYAITILPPVGWLAARLYDVWARLRLRLTGRPALSELIRERQRVYTTPTCPEKDVK